MLISLWEISGAVRAVMGALSRIFEREETHSIWHRFGLSFALALGLAVCTRGALSLTSRGGWVDRGPAQPLWTLIRRLAVVFGTSRSPASASPVPCPPCRSSG